MSGHRIMGILRTYSVLLMIALLMVALFPSERQFPDPPQSPEHPEPERSPCDHGERHDAGDHRRRVRPVRRRHIRGRRRRGGLDRPPCRSLPRGCCSLPLAGLALGDVQRRGDHPAQRAFVPGDDRHEPGLQGRGHRDLGRPPHPGPPRRLHLAGQGKDRRRVHRRHRLRRVRARAYLRAEPDDAGAAESSRSAATRKPRSFRESAPTGSRSPLSRSRGLRPGWRRRSPSPASPWVRRAPEPAWSCRPSPP